MAKVKSQKRKGDKPKKRKSNKPKTRKGDKPKTRKGDKPKTRKGDKPKTRKGDSPSATPPTSNSHKTAKISDEEIAASQAVVDEWARRVEAEYRSAAVTQHLTLWLIQMGASPDLIHDGLRIVVDELAHAELSYHAFVAAGGSQVPPLSRESLALPTNPDESLEAAVTRWGVEVFCLGETVAVPLFKVLRQECVVPTARNALDRVLRDEVRHRDFGWTLLEYLLATPSESQVRAIVEQELPDMFARLRRNYAPVGGEQQTEISRNDRSWGLMAIAQYADILDRTYERDYRPRFGRLGFDSDPAWQKAIELQPQVGN